MSNDFSCNTTPIAKKTHQCQWCGESIEVGEKHHKFFGRWQGDMQDWRMHVECYSVADRTDLEEGFEPFHNERPYREPVPPKFDKSVSYFTAPLLAALEASRIRHQHNPNDAFLCCAACDICIQDGAKERMRLGVGECDCGADAHNARIDNAVRAHLARTV